MKRTVRALLTALLLISICAQLFTTAGAAATPDMTVTPLPAEVTGITAAAQGYAVVQNAAGAYGVLDATGRWVVNFGSYPWIDAYSEGLALVKAGAAANWHWAYIDTTGQEVLNASAWDLAGSFHNGLARVGKNQAGGVAYSFIDTTGALKLDCSAYSAVGEFSDGYALVETTQGDTVSYGFIDTAGTTIIGGLQSATDFSGGYALVQVYNTLSRKNVACLIDTTGTPTVDLSKYTNLSPVSDGLLLVSPQAGSERSGLGYMDLSGQIVIDCSSCEFIYPFSDGYGLTEYLDNAGNLCYAYLDKTGDTAFDLGTCDLAVPFCDGYAIYQDGDTWYLMDTRGSITFSSRRYDSLDSCSEGVLVASREENGSRVYDLLRVDGTVLAASLRYDFVDAFHDSLALAYQLDSATGTYYYYYIDSTGTVQLDCSDYDSVGAFSDGLLLVSNFRTDADGYFAGYRSWFLDKAGNVVLDCSAYDNVSAFSDGLALVTGSDSRTLEDVSLFLDKAGNVALDCSAYDNVTSFHDGAAIVTREEDGVYRHALMDTDGALLTGWLDYNTLSGYAQSLAVANYTATAGTVDQAFYMNTDGTVALEGLDYDGYDSFQDGVAIVGRARNGQTLYGGIDKTGSLVVDLEYDQLLPVSDGVTWGRKNGTWYSLRQLELPFADVAADAWYRSSVQAAYAAGLMNGVDDTHFDPDGAVTLAQAVTMAVRAYCRYYELADVRTAGAAVWYQPYVDYAIHAGLLNADDFVNFEVPATRGQLAYLFSRVLPESDYAIINRVDRIPDVSDNYIYRSQVYTMYRSGIVTGYEDGSFRPNEGVTRSQVAAIIARVIDPGQRVTLG